MPNIQRQTLRQTNSHTETKHRQRKIQTHTYRKTERHIHTDRHREADIYRRKHTYRQTHPYMQTMTYRQTHTDTYRKQRHKQTNIHTGIQRALC